MRSQQNAWNNKSRFTVKIIKSFEILHFDIIINDTEFDEIKCIAPFTNEFILYNWVYSFINYKKITLFFMFKLLINQCDCVDLVINAIVFVIRFDQETSIEKNWKHKSTNKKSNGIDSRKIFHHKMKNANVLTFYWLKKLNASKCMQNFLKNCILNII